MPDKNLEEAQAFLDEAAAKRGYVHRIHKLLAAHDLDTLKAIDHVASAVYLNQRTLDRKTKELLFCLSMTVLKLPQAQIQTHIKAALDAGASEQEILEAISMALPEAGVPAFAHGLYAWAEVVGAEPLEPTGGAYEGGPIKRE